MKIIKAQLIAWPLILCTLLSGCAVVHPFVGEKSIRAPAKTGDNSNTEITYDFAEEKANSLETEVICKRKQLHDFKFWSGAGLVGSGIASAGMVAYGANQSLLIGASLFAGTFIGARTYVPIDTRLKIYSTTLNAIESAKMGVYPIATNADAPTPKQFQEAVEMAQKSFADGGLDSSDASVLTAPYQIAGQLVSAAEAATAEFNSDTNRGILLFKALITIVNKANNDLVDENLDPTAALQAATNGIADARAKVGNANLKASTAASMILQQNMLATILVQQKLAFRKQLTEFQLQNQYLDQEIREMAHAAVATNSASIQTPIKEESAPEPFLAPEQNKTLDTSSLDHLSDMLDQRLRSIHADQ